MSSADKTVMFAMPNLVSGQLACVEGTAAGRSWELSAGTFTIGRSEEHDMSLAAEPGVSKFHAKIIGQGDRYLIMDCESRNGTLVNGELVQKADLYDGDEIRICGCVLRFTQKGGPKRPVRRGASAGADPAATGLFQQPNQQPNVPNSAPPPMAVPMQQPMQMQPMQPIVVQAPSSRGLGTFFMGGLVTSLLLGGAASAALIAQGPPPVDTLGDKPLVPVEVGANGNGKANANVATPNENADLKPAESDLKPAESDLKPAESEPNKVAEVEANKPALDSPSPEDVAVGDDDDNDDDDSAVVATAADAKPKKRRSSSGSSEPASGPFPASVDTGKSEMIRTKTGGRVKTAVADGITVERGTVLVTFESGADPGEVATLEDRIAGLEGVESEEAKRDQKAAKAKLAALQGGQNAAPLVAGVEGILSGFTATVGAVLKPGEVVGKIADPNFSPRVKVTVARSTKPKSGQRVTMNLKSGGSVSGSVVAVSGRTVIVDPGGEPADNVASVSF